MRFINRLALQLGMLPGDLLDSISSREINDLAAYYASEPWGIEALDYLFAQVCCTIANVFGSRNKRFRIEDFLLFARRQVKPMTIAEMKRKAIWATKMMGGKVQTSGT